MIEIMFSESAACSMQMVKSLNNIVSSSTSVVFRKSDGGIPTPEELELEQARVEEEHRKKHENAVPVEGNSKDVACIPLNLSIGDISEPFSDERVEFLQSMVLIAGEDFTGIGRELMETARKSREKILNTSGSVRIWTSHNPDELCGFCHILTCLPENADIRVVELPDHEVLQNEIRSYSGWGEIEPTDLGRFQTLERSLSATERRYFAGLWRELQRENGKLRAVVNSRLCTVGEDFYDHFILRELEMETEQLHEGRLIGRILGKYLLGLSDSLVALRIEELIFRGMLVPVTAPAEGCPIYHRYLKQVKRGGKVEPDDWRLLSVDDGLKCKELNPTDCEELGLHAPYLTHCAFCWIQVEHTRHPFWYIPTDLSCCICEKCYHDFRELFQWRELDGWDMEWKEEA